MKSILITILLTFLLVFVPILVQYAICQDLKKSVHSVISFIKKLFIEIIKELFGNSDNTFYYPVRFGAGINGEITLENVDASFETIYKLFDPDGTYCGGVWENPDLIQYGFTISFDDGNILNVEGMKDIIQKRLEKMLNQSFKEHGIYIPVGRYLDFKFDQENKPQCLYIWFAKTDKGANLLQQQKAQRLCAKRSSQNTNSEDFNAEWEGDETNENRH